MATLGPGFNERLYDFCVNFELVTQAGALIAGYLPGIPSPQDEADLGWDAKISMPAFGATFLLQYKVARLTTARVGANARFWDTYGDEYYRFGLHKDKNGAYTQHQLLLDEAALGAQSLYCAPLMHTRAELVAAVQSGTVLGRSALIPVASLGPASIGFPHSVTYPVDDLNGVPTLHSEPQRGERLAWIDIERSASQRSHPLDEASFEALSATVLEGRPRRRRRERTVRAEDPAAAAYLRASAIVLDELGATLVVLPAQAPTARRRRGDP